MKAAQETLEAAWERVISSPSSMLSPLVRNNAETQPTQARAKKSDDMSMTAQMRAPVRKHTAAYKSGLLIGRMIGGAHERS